MTPPPAHGLAIGDTAQVAELTLPSEKVRRFRLQLQPGDLVALMDIWALLALFWSAKVLFDLDNSMAVFAVATFAGIVSPRVRRPRLTNSVFDDASTIITRVAIAYAIASAAVVLGGEAMGDARTLFSVGLLTVPTLVVGRSLSYRAEAALGSRVRSRAIVLGAGLIARRLVLTLAEHKEYGLEVVGALDDDPRFDAKELGTRILGGVSCIEDLVKERGIDVVIVAFSAGDQADTIAAIRSAQTAGATVWLIPRFFELGSSGTGGDHLWGLPVVRLDAPAQARPEWMLKRVFDVVVSAMGLAVLSPILGIVAAAIYLGDRGPIFFRQVRIGHKGQPFEILKFRSMSVVDDSRQQTEWCNSAGMRVTRIGKIIRKTGLDEIPQLINVLKGEMSLVGPRPERPHFVEEFSSKYREYSGRHRLPVGVTGWSQVNGLRGDTSIEERAVFDNYYVENWSWAQDLKILLRTPKALLKGE